MASSHIQKQNHLITVFSLDEFMRLSLCLETVPMQLVDVNYESGAGCRMLRTQLLSATFLRDFR
jgi:hypothetical protein